MGQMPPSPKDTGEGPELITILYLVATVTTVLMAGQVTRVFLDPGTHRD